MRVLVTRPEPDASRTAASLEKRGHRTVVDSLLSIEPVASALPTGNFAALAATSASAARVAGARLELESLRALPLYAVGSSTAQAAREAGFMEVHDADGDAAALARLLAGSLASGSRILHLAGEDRAQDLGPLLAAERIEVDVFVLYRMRVAEAFGPAAAALASGELDAALHFSSRSAATFVALAERHDLVGAARKLRHLCLSVAVAAPLAQIGAPVEIAASPREDTLMELLDS